MLGEGEQGQRWPLGRLSLRPPDCVVTSTHSPRQGPEFNQICYCTGFTQHGDYKMPQILQQVFIKWAHFSKHVTEDRDLFSVHSKTVL